MYVLYKLFNLFCFCFNKKKVKEDEIELLQPLDSVDYNLMDNIDLIPKYLNYKFEYDIDDNKFICSSISILVESVINKNIQFTILSRQNNNKNFFSIQGNENYNLFEINCIRGDILEFNFKFNKKNILYVMYTNKNDAKFTEKYEIFHKKISILTYENCNNIKFFLKFEDDNSFYQDLISQTTLWFKDFDINNNANIDLESVINKENNSVLIGYIKLSSNLLIYNH